MREIEEIQIEKEVKMSLFAGSILLHIKYPKDSTRNFIQFINTLNRVVEDKVDVQKAVGLPITKRVY